MQEVQAESHLTAALQMHDDPILPMVFGDVTDDDKGDDRDGHGRRRIQEASAEWLHRRKNIKNRIVAPFEDVQNGRQPVTGGENDQAGSDELERRTANQIEVATKNDADDEKRQPRQHGMRVVDKNSQKQIVQRVNLVGVQPVGRMKIALSGFLPSAQSRSHKPSDCREHGQVSSSPKNETGTQQKICAVKKQDGSWPRMIEEIAANQQQGTAPRQSKAEYSCLAAVGKTTSHQQRSSDSSNYDERRSKAGTQDAGVRVKHTMPKITTKVLIVQTSVVVHDNHADQSNGSSDIETDESLRSEARGALGRMIEVGQSF